MEELALLTCMAVAAIAWGVVMFLVDLVGLASGFGWRHFSKQRAARKAELKHE